MEPLARVTMEIVVILRMRLMVSVLLKTASKRTLKYQRLVPVTAHLRTTMNVLLKKSACEVVSAHLVEMGMLRSVKATAHKRGPLTSVHARQMHAVLPANNLKTKRSVDLGAAAAALAQPTLVVVVLVAAVLRTEEVAARIVVNATMMALSLRFT